MKIRQHIGKQYLRTGATTAAFQLLKEGIEKPTESAKSKYINIDTNRNTTNNEAIVNNFNLIDVDTVIIDNEQ